MTDHISRINTYSDKPILRSMAMSCDATVIGRKGHVQVPRYADIAFHAHWLCWIKTELSSIIRGPLSYGQYPILCLAQQNTAFDYKKSPYNPSRRWKSWTTYIVWNHWNTRDNPRINDWTAVVLTKRGMVQNAKVTGCKKKDKRCIFVKCDIHVALL